MEAIDPAADTVREATEDKGKIINSLTDKSMKYDFFAHENGIAVYEKWTDDLVGSWHSFDDMMDTGLGDR